jgi:cytidylate kinase
MADRARVDALKIFLQASEEVRAGRISDREGGAATQRLREIQAREASDHRRYLDLYGVDYHDLTRYDLVMETDRRTPEEVAQAIVEQARARFAAGDDRR